MYHSFRQKNNNKNKHDLRLPLIVKKFKISRRYYALISVAGVFVIVFLSLANAAGFFSLFGNAATTTAYGKTQVTPTQPTSLLSAVTTSGATQATQATLPDSPVLTTSTAPTSAGSFGTAISGTNNINLPYDSKTNTSGWGATWSPADIQQSGLAPSGATLNQNYEVGGPGSNMGYSNQDYSYPTNATFSQLNITWYVANSTGILFEVNDGTPNTQTNNGMGLYDCLTWIYDNAPTIATSSTYGGSTSSPAPQNYAIYFKNATSPVASSLVSGLAGPSSTALGSFTSLAGRDVTSLTLEGLPTAGSTQSGLFNANNSSTLATLSAMTNPTSTLNADGTPVVWNSATQFNGQSASAAMMPSLNLQNWGSTSGTGKGVNFGVPTLFRNMSLYVGSSTGSRLYGNGNNLGFQNVLFQCQSSTSQFIYGGGDGSTVTTASTSNPTSGSSYVYLSGAGNPSSTNLAPLDVFGANDNSQASSTASSTAIANQGEIFKGNANVYLGSLMANQTIEKLAGGSSGFNNINGNTNVTVQDNYSGSTGLTIGSAAFSTGGNLCSGGTQTGSSTLDFADIPSGTTWTSGAYGGSGPLTTTGDSGLTSTTTGSTALFINMTGSSATSITGGVVGGSACGTVGTSGNSNSTNLDVKSSGALTLPLIVGGMASGTVNGSSLAAVIGGASSTIGASSGTQGVTGGSFNGSNVTNGNTNISITVGANSSVYDTQGGSLTGTVNGSSRASVTTGSTTSVATGTNGYLLGGSSGATITGNTNLTLDYGAGNSIATGSTDVIAGGSYGQTIGGATRLTIDGTGGSGTKSYVGGTSATSNGGLIVGGSAGGSAATVGTSTTPTSTNLLIQNTGTGDVFVPDSCLIGGSTSATIYGNSALTILSTGSGASFGSAPLWNSSNWTSTSSWSQKYVPISSQSTAPANGGYVSGGSVQGLVSGNVYTSILSTGNNDGGTSIPQIYSGGVGQSGSSSSVTVGGNVYSNITAGASYGIYYGGVLYGNISGSVQNIFTPNLSSGTVLNSSGDAKWGLSMINSNANGNGSSTGNFGYQVQQTSSNSLSTKSYGMYIGGSLQGNIGTASTTQSGSTGYAVSNDFDSSSFIYGFAFFSGANDGVLHMGEGATGGNFSYGTSTGTINGNVLNETTANGTANATGVINATSKINDSSTSWAGALEGFTGGNGVNATLLLGSQLGVSSSATSATWGVPESINQPLAVNSTTPTTFNTNAATNAQSVINGNVYSNLNSGIFSIGSSCDSNTQNFASTGVSIDKSDSSDNIWAGVVRGGSYFGYQNGQTYLSIGTTGLVTSTWGAGLLNSASGTAGTAFGNLPANLNSLYSESNNTYANGSGFEVTASGASNTGVFEAAGGTTGLGNFVNYYQNGSSTLISGSTPAAGFGLVATQVYGGAFSGYQNGSSGATQANYASGTYINGGMIGQAFGGGRSAGITFGDSELKITGGQIDTVATGGDYDVAFHKGNANTEMDGGIINGSLVGTLISSGYWASGGSGKNWNIAYVTNTGTAWSSSNSLYYSPMQLIGSTQVRITGGDYSGAPNGSDLSHKTICGGPVNGQENGSSNIAVDAENATSSSSASPMVGVSSSTLLKFSPGVPFTGGGAPAEQITNANGSLQDTEPWMGSGLTSSINLFIYGNPSQSVLNGAQLSGDSMSAYRADGSANFGGYQTDGNPNVDTDISGVNMTVDAPKDSFGNIYASDYPIAHNTHFLTYYNGIATSGLNYNVNINVLNAGQIMNISGGQGYAAPETSSNTLFDMPMRNGSVYPTGNASNATGVINPSFSSTTVESFTSSNVNWNSSTGSVSSGSNTALVTLGNSANKIGLNHIYLADRLENFTSLDVKNNGILTLNYNPNFNASSTYGTVTGWTANSSVVAATTNGTGITNPGQPILTATQSGATESPSGVVWTAAQPTWTERTSTDATTSQPVGTVYGVSGWTQGINNPSMTYYDPNYESMIGLDTQGTVLNGASAQQMTGTFSNSATGASGSSGTYATGESAYQFANCEFDSKSGIFTGAFWGNSWANQSTTTTFNPLTTQVYLGNVILDGDSEFSTPYLTTDRIINMHSISMVTTGSKMTWRGNNIAVGTSTSPVNINTSPVSGLSKTENGTYWGTSSSSMPFITFDQKAGTSDGIANINEVNFLGDDPNSMYGYGLLGDTDKTDTAYTATDEIFLGAGQIREFDTNNAKAGGGSWAFNSGFSSDFTTDATTPMGTGDNVGKKVLVTAYDSNGNVLTGSQWNTGATKIVLMYPSSTYAPTSSGGFYSFPSATTGGTLFTGGATETQQTSNDPFMFEASSGSYVQDVSVTAPVNGETGVSPGIYDYHTGSDEDEFISANASGYSTYDNTTTTPILPPTTNPSVTDWPSPITSPSGSATTLVTAGTPNYYIAADGTDGNAPYSWSWTGTGQNGARTLFDPFIAYANSSSPTTTSYGYNHLYFPGNSSNGSYNTSEANGNVYSRYVVYTAKTNDVSTISAHSFILTNSEAKALTLNSSDSVNGSANLYSMSAITGTGLASSSTTVTPSDQSNSVLTAVTDINKGLSTGQIYRTINLTWTDTTSGAVGESTVTIVPDSTSDIASDGSGAMAWAQSSTMDDTVSSIIKDDTGIQDPSIGGTGAVLLTPLQNTYTVTVTPLSDFNATTAATIKTGLSTDTGNGVTIPTAQQTTGIQYTGTSTTTGTGTYVSGGQFTATGSSAVNLANDTAVVDSLNGTATDGTAASATNDMVTVDYTAITPTGQTLTTGTTNGASITVSTGDLSWGTPNEITFGTHTIDTTHAWSTLGSPDQELFIDDSIPAASQKGWLLDVTIITPLLGVNTNYDLTPYLTYNGSVITSNTAVNAAYYDPILYPSGGYTTYPGWDSTMETSSATTTMQVPYGLDSATLASVAQQANLFDLSKNWSTAPSWSTTALNSGTAAETQGFALSLPQTAATQRADTYNGSVLWTLSKGPVTGD